jgi:hypothetical protein
LDLFSFVLSFNKERWINKHPLTLLVGICILSLPVVLFGGIAL